MWTPRIALVLESLLAAVAVATYFLFIEGNIKLSNRSPLGLGRMRLRRARPAAPSQLPAPGRLHIPLLGPRRRGLAVLQQSLQQPTCAQRRCRQ